MYDITIIGAAILDVLARNAVQTCHRLRKEYERLITT